MKTPSSEQTSCLTFEWSHDETPSIAVVHAVAAVSGEDPTKMKELYAAIDPDALDALFVPTRASATRPTGTVEFCYSGYRIRIDADGTGKVIEQ